MGDKARMFLHQFKALHSISSFCMYESTIPSLSSFPKACGMLAMGGSRKLKTVIVVKKYGPVCEVYVKILCLVTGSHMQKVFYLFIQFEPGGILLVNYRQMLTQSKYIFRTIQFYWIEFIF